MKRFLTVSIVGVLMMLYFTGHVAAGVSAIGNGSFEADGLISSVTSDNTPTHWPMVSIPQDKFIGQVTINWASHGDYSLFFTVQNVATEQGDMAIVSQDVFLDETDSLIFDLKVGTPQSWIVPWDYEKRSVVVMVDSEIVWDSSTDLTPNGSHTYYDLSVDLSDYNDPNLHTLGFGVKINDNLDPPGLPMWAFIDFAGFDSHCEGAGYYRSDLTGPNGTRDCVTNFFDFSALANHWLSASEWPYDEFDLTGDDEFVNEADMDVIAENWLMESYGDLQVIQKKDYNKDGIINFIDYAIVVDANDLQEPEDVNDFSQNWLDRNWIYWLNN